MKKFLPYIITYILIFALLPLLISITPLISGMNTMFTLVLTMLILTIIGMIYGRNHGFALLLPVFAVILFIPFGFINTYTTARIIFTSITFFVATLIGNLTGLMFRKK